MLEAVPKQKRDGGVPENMTVAQMDARSLELLNGLQKLEKFVSRGIEKLQDTPLSNDQRAKLMSDVEIAQLRIANLSTQRQDLFEKKNTLSAGAVPKTINGPWDDTYTGGKAKGDRGDSAGGRRAYGA